MSKFDDHWDMRIVANQRLFDERPGLANFVFDEAYLAYEFAKVEAAKNLGSNIQCLMSEIYLLADCMCLEYHECVNALKRIDSLEKALKFYAAEDKESVEDGILESVYDRPATAALEVK